MCRGWRSISTKKNAKALGRGEQELSDSENLKPFPFCGAGQTPIQSDEGKALGILLGGQERSGELFLSLAKLIGFERIFS